MTDRPTIMRLTRLTERSQFLAAAGKGRRFRASGFTAQVLDRDDPRREHGTQAGQDPAATALRLGLTASRHVGNAPVRNRVRRRLRAAAELALESVAEQPVDLVLVARRETLGVSFAQLKIDIAQSITRARPAAAGKSFSQPRSGKRPPVQPDQKR